jgi:hypothetical protein
MEQFSRMRLSALGIMLMVVLIILVAIGVDISATADPSLMERTIAGGWLSLRIGMSHPPRAQRGSMPTICSTAWNCISAIALSAMEVRMPSQEASQNPCLRDRRSFFATNMLVLIGAPPSSSAMGCAGQGCLLSRDSATTIPGRSQPC